MYKLFCCFAVIAFAGSVAVTPPVFSGDRTRSHKRPAVETNAPDKKLHKECLYPTVKISNVNHDSGGSGFIVRSTKVGDKWHNAVLTCTHVVKNEEGLQVHVGEYEHWSEIKGYKKYPLVVYAADPKHDMAVAFFTSDEEMPVATLNFDTRLYINTEVFRIGYSLFDDARLDYGQVTQPKTSAPHSYKGMIRTNVFTFLGDSGGPLFLKSNYEVVGMCESIRGRNGVPLCNMSFYRPITALKTFDTEVNNALESVYKHKAPMPVLPFVKLELLGYDHELPELDK